MGYPLIPFSRRLSPPFHLTNTLECRERNRGNSHLLLISTAAIILVEVIGFKRVPITILNIPDVSLLVPLHVSQSNIHLSHSWVQSLKLSHMIILIIWSGGGSRRCFCLIVCSFVASLFLVKTNTVIILFFFLVWDGTPFAFYDFGSITLLLPSRSRLPESSLHQTRLSREPISSRTTHSTS